MISEGYGITKVIENLETNAEINPGAKKNNMPRPGIQSIQHYDTFKVRVEANSLHV